LSTAAADRRRHGRRGFYRPQITAENFGAERKEDAVTGLRVTPVQLQSLGAVTTRVSGDVRGQHQQLRGQLGPLFGADWSGAAAAQFAALYERFDAHARGLSDALDGIGSLLRHAGYAYAEVEQQITASFR
jgi:WXG100 family type VII secretion target